MGAAWTSAAPRIDFSSWVSVTDLILLFSKMKFLASLPKEMHAPVVQRLWRNVRRVPPGEELVSFAVPNDRLVMILGGEAEAGCEHVYSLRTCQESLHRSHKVARCLCPLLSQENPAATTRSKRG